ncbi:glycosyltransferase family 4 protein [Roseibium sp.]|uniref:glycosyltransferase family 4 protein n=1 Tax=Roseibium sp. TaxID=1936156 RepID=UPI003A96B986
MKVAVVLPRGMRFSPDGATSIDIVAHDLICASRFRSSTYVIGEQNEAPFEDVDFRPVATGRPSFVAREVVAELAFDRPDVIVVHQHPETAARIARGVPGIPVLLHRHGLLKESRGFLSRWRKERQLSQMAGIIFVSDFIRQSFLAQFPKLANRTGVIFNAVDTALWHPSTEKRKEVVYVGRARQDKGILPLIAAFKTLTNPDWCLKLILGVQTDTEAAFFAEVESRTANSSKIELLKNEQSAAVQDHLARASIAALPSIVREGFPRAVVEAMACGCAVVATRQGGTPEAAGDAAILLETPDASDFTARLSETLKDLTMDRDLLGEMCSKARAHALSNLGIEAVARSYDDLLSRTAGL